MPAGGRLLVGGLGVGFSLREALDHPAVGEVVVVEREPAVIGWNKELARQRRRCSPTHACGVVRADLLTWLPTAGRFDALCLDIDNGPEWTVDEGNAALYGPAGLAMLADALAPGRRAGGVERGQGPGVRGGAGRPVRPRGDPRDPGPARRAGPGVPGDPIEIGTAVTDHRRVANPQE